MDELSRLIEWGLEKGVRLPSNVKFVRDELKGISCISTAVVTDSVIEVPESIIFCGKLADSSFTGVNDTNRNSYLKFLLARLKFNAFDEDNSICQELHNQFFPYIDALPNVIDSPLVWNPTELSLLGFTNLAQTVPIKLKSIMDEWYELILVLNETYNFDLGEEIKLFLSYQDYDFNDIHNLLFSQSSLNSKIKWYSFKAFLWAHLIFTSRAFPEYIINKTCCKNAVMLLPVLDLLNHDPISKVEWSSDNGNFCYKNLNDFPSNVELTNNYGGKGNEELLLGYGFVLNDNLFDSVALKINLPKQDFEKVLTVPGLKLPTMEDYTWFAFDQNSKMGTKNFSSNQPDLEDGVLYFINQNNTECLNPLLDLFTAISLNQKVGENLECLRPRLEAIQNLLMALNHKHSYISQAGGIFKNSCDKIDPYRESCAKIYKSQQLQILTHGLKLLKSIEKELLSSNKKNLLTVSKLLKSDPTFFETEIAELLGIQDVGSLSFDSSFHLLILWVIAKQIYHSMPEKYSWAQKMLEGFSENYISIEETKKEAEAVHESIFKNSPSLTINHIELAMAFVSETSVTRGSSSDTLLIKNCERNLN